MEGGWPWLPLLALRLALAWAQRRERAGCPGSLGLSLATAWNGVAVLQPSLPWYKPAALGHRSALVCAPVLRSILSGRSQGFCVVALVLGPAGPGPSGHFAADSPAAQGLCARAPGLSVPALSQQAWALAGGSCCCSGFQLVAAGRGMMLLARGLVVVFAAAAVYQAASGSGVDEHWSVLRPQSCQKRGRAW